MLSSFRHAAAVAVFSLCTLGSAGESAAAFYASVSGLLPIATEVEADIASEITVEPDLGVGFGLSSAIGTTLLPGLRLELEGSFLGYEGDEADFTFDFGGAPVTLSNQLDTRVTVVTWMVNAYYEPSLPLPLSPYIGAGAGIAGIALEGSDPFAGTLLDDEAEVFAFQVLAGASFPLAPGTDLFGGYRFLLLDTADLTDVFGNPVEVEFQSHMLELGVRFGF